MATYFNDGVTLRFVSSNDDSELQQRQIDSLAASGIDLLIFSPNQVDLFPRKSTRSTTPVSL